MDSRNRCEGFPGNSMIASFVFDVLEQRGVLRRNKIAEAIRDVWDKVPPHLIGEERIASLSALRSLMDDPNASRVTLRKWFNS